MKKQSSPAVYLILGLTTFGASALVFFILFFSGWFKVTIANNFAILIIGFVYGVSLFSVMALIYNWHEAPERARILQSHQMLTIANETLTYLRQGFNYQTAEAVAKIILNGTTTDAVAVTDNEAIMDFRGTGAQYYKPGDVLDKQVIKADKENELVIYMITNKTLYPNNREYKWRGISVPLRIQNRVIGTLEFLYLWPRRIKEKHITVAKSLSKLLSRQLELSELDKQRDLAFQAEFKALRAQINPHFLFNTLNTIASLCRTEPLTARDLLLKFSDLFRDSLERQSQISSLDEELKYLSSYIALERARFGDKLNINTKIDPRARSVIVPSIILQPIVENSIKHGMSDKGRLSILLSAVFNNGNLLITVRDDGVGMNVEKFNNKSHNDDGLGIGLTNIRERLSTLYGSEDLLSISSEPGRGTEVRLTIPTREDK